MAKGAYIGIGGTARKVAGGYIGVDGVARKITKAYIGVNGVAQVWWMPEEASGPIVLEVEKITSNTYAGETTYNSEQFILLDIYGTASDSVISVTYGGLTKTLQGGGTNAQQVFFGTFNGVSDTVETPASGTLTIEGDYTGVGCGAFMTSSKSTLKNYCSCITAAADLSGIKRVPGSAFKECKKLTSVILPEGVATLTGETFSGCSVLNRVVLPNSLTSMYRTEFTGCVNLTDLVVGNGNKSFSSEGGVLFSKDKTILQNYPSAAGSYVIPNSVTSINNYAFNSTNLTSVTIHEGVTNIGGMAFGSCSNLTSVTILATTPPTLGTSAFSTSGSLTITVPAGCGEAYKAAENWSGYADRIVEG